MHFPACMREHRSRGLGQIAAHGANVKLGTAKLTAKQTQQLDKLSMEVRLDVHAGAFG